MRLQAADEEGGYLTLGWRLAAPWYWQQRKWVGRASLALRQDLGNDGFIELTMMVAVENERSRTNSALGLTSQGFKAHCELSDG